MDAVIYLVIVVVIAVVAVRLGMIVAPWVARMASSDDEDDAAPADRAATADTAAPSDATAPADEEPG